MRDARGLLTVVFLVGTTCLLGANHINWRGGELGGIEGSRRLWEDFTVAQSRFHASPNEPLVSIAANGRTIARLREVIPVRVAQAEIKPWEFWRAVNVPVRLRQPAFQPRETDDRGRSDLLLAAFRLFGGVAPMMLLWVGVLVAAPLLSWLVAELALADRIWAAGIVGVGLASSPFLVMALSLPYAPMGFYLAAIIVLMALSVSAFLGGEKARGAFLFRVVIAGLLFVLLLRCRSSVVFLAPAFAMACVCGIWRRTTTLDTRPRRLWIGGSLFLLLLPWMLLRPQGHHEVFLGLWEGLGDFDRSKGHHWNDPVAKDFLERNGRGIPRTDPIWAYDNEDLFRKAFVDDISSDPVWYAEILLKRTVSALGLTRLWTDRLRALEPSENTIGVYWGMAPPVHRFRFGETTMPIWPPILIILSVTAALLRPSGDGSLLAVCLVAALALPVIFTTASGVETQGLGLVYFLGSALAIDSLLRKLSVARAALLGGALRRRLG